MIGHQRFIDLCRAAGWPVAPFGKLAPCSASIDVAVAAFLAESGGGRFGGLRFCPPGELAAWSADKRHSRPDLPWLDELSFFASWEGTSYTLASVPGLADESGRQPVIYVDLHETTRIVPIASSGELAFQRLADHVEAIVAAGADPADGPFFPDSIDDRMAGDFALQAMIAGGAFARFTAP